MAFWKKDSENKKDDKPHHADIGRNDPCHCGSGKKYKKCCMEKDLSAEHKVIEENWAKSEAAAKEQAEKQEKEAKDTKEAPAAPAKHGGNPQSTKQRHPSFVPTQVNLPRKSGGG
jgi:hypothetical protein